MNIMLTFRHFVPAKNLSQQVTKKIKRLFKHLGPSAKIEWTMVGEKNHYRSEVKILDSGNKYYVRAQNSDINKTFDDAMKKLKKQFGYTRRYATVKQTIKYSN